MTPPLWWILLVWLLAAVAYADPSVQPGPQTVGELVEQLESTEGCNRTLDSPLVQRLLNSSLADLERQEPTIFWLGNLVSKHSYLIGKSMPLNATMTTQPLAVPIGKQPALALHLLCQPGRRDDASWTGVAVYATSVANTFLQVQLPHLEINACQLSQCSAKCVSTTHGSLRVLATACCGDDETLCRSGFPIIRKILIGITGLFAVLCAAMIPASIRERKRQQQEARGWALMELFFAGAILIYLIPIIDWLLPSWSMCILSVWLREIGFTLFYGSVILKIFRNLQEYRVRKAHHVYVREQDLLKYLAFLAALTITGLLAWMVGSMHYSALWNSMWPRCLIEKWSWWWPLYELVFLLYGLRLCHKAFHSQWGERLQFSWVVFSEAFFGTIFNIWRYNIMHDGNEDYQYIIASLQLHTTLSLNVLAILVPKMAFATGDSNRRTLTMTGAAGSSGRAHPSLAKLRDNLINGTIDFAEIPIVDMNPEDIRAELKRVYTQLRMYKLKNLYQDNPHISKRKGGKKTSDKNAKNRRISIPPTSSSPKARRLDEEEEKSDLTVESAPHNVYLSTQKIQLEPADQSVRV